MKQTGRARILVVDDDAKVLGSLELVLRGRYELCAAPNGDEALRVVAEKSVDLMFLDIRMGDGPDGLEVLERLKKRGETFPVVMLTASQTVKTAVQAMKLGAVDYLTKPFDPEEIVAVAEKALENFRLRKEVLSLRS